MRIGVSGPPGSGKTTLSKRLAKELDYFYVSGGDIFRNEAKKRNMSVEEFSSYAEINPNVDIELDNILVEESRKLRVIVDSRLSGWLMKINNIKAFKVYIDASLEERARRIHKRDGGNVEEIKKRILERESSELRRYSLLYGVDYRDPSIYDLIIFTDSLDEERVFYKVLEEFLRWLKNYW